MTGCKDCERLREVIRSAYERRNVDDDCSESLRWEIERWAKSAPTAPEPQEREGGER